MSAPGSAAATRSDASPEPAAQDPPRGSELAHVPLLLLPGALVVLFSFRAGGFFPGSTAAVAIGMILVLVLRITLARRPFEGAGVAWIAGAALLALFTVWTLLSGTWSKAPARALVEYDRALLYLLVFVVFGALGRTPQRMRWLVRGLALGIAVVCVCALMTRLAPDVWRVETQIARERLSYPLTYWARARTNSAACSWLACSRRWAPSSASASPPTDGSPA